MHFWQRFADVRFFVSEKLSYHKHLHGGIEFVDSIPETGTGKELRRELRDAYLRRIEASPEVVL